MGKATFMAGTVAAVLISALAVQPAAADETFKTVQPGVLTVATGLGNPGWINGTDPENIDGGVEWALANELAKELGIPKVVFRNVSFTPLVTGSLSDYDLGMLNIFKTEARQKVNKYSDCYYTENNAALVKKGTKLSNVEDARKLQWGHVTGGYAGLIMQRLQPTLTPKSFQDGPTQYNALLSGTVDGILDDLSSTAGRSNSKGFENTEVVAIIELKGTNPPCSAVQLPASAPDTNVEAVNKVIKKLNESGQLKKWMAEYLAPNGVDPNQYPRIEVE